MNKIRISAILAMLCTTACAENVSVMATRKYVDNATNAVYDAAKGYVDTAVKDAGKVQSVNGKTGEVELAASDVGALTAESDPVFAAWTNGASIVAGKGATNIFGGVIIGNGAKGGGVVIGENADSGPDPNVAIGKNTASGYFDTIVIGSLGYYFDGTPRTEAQGSGTFNISTADPAHFWFGAAGVDLSGAEITPRTLQSYLDERATTTTLNAYSNELAEAIANSAPAAALSAHAADTDNPHGVTAAQLGALTAESDPVFAAWTNGTSIAIGLESSADACVAIGTSSKARDLSVAIGEDAKATGNSSVVIGCLSTATNSSTIVIGNMAHAIGRGSIAIGHEVYVTNESCIAFGEFPSNVLFGATYGAYWEIDPPARTLQSYLDERVKTTEIANVAKSGDYNDLTDKPAFVAASGEVVFSNNWKGVRFYGDVTHHGPATFNDTVTFNGTTAFAKGVKATSLGASGWYSNAEQSVELSAHTKSGGNDHNYIHIVSRGDEGTKVSNITPDNSDVLTWNMLNAAIPSILDALDSETATAADIVVALQSIYARFYTVKYVDNTGDGSVTKKVREGRYAKEPAKPTSSTSTFLGWYASGATNAFDFAGTPITNDVTLTAKWEAN